MHVTARQPLNGFWILCLIIVLFAVGIICKEGIPSDRPSSVRVKNCSLENFYFCLSKIQTVIQNEELALASTLFELQNVCRKLEDGYRCIDSHMERCSKKLEKVLYEQMVQGTRQVITELCKPRSILQDMYLRYAPCFKRLSSAGGKCSEKYQRMIQLSKEEPGDQNTADIEEGLRRTCCTFNEYVHCYYHHTLELCGEEGRNFFMNYTEKMSGTLMHEHCATYTYRDAICAGSAQGVSARDGLLTFYAFFLILLLSVRN